MTNTQRDFTVERYVAFCFSIEFLLKALLCIDKNNAQAKVLQKYGHKMGDAKTAALAVVQDQPTKDLLNQFFKKYPELENRDVIQTRYGVLGSLTSYDAGLLTDELYPEMLRAANQTIHAEWGWRDK